MPGLYAKYRDEELIEFLRDGDHAAFTEIFKRYWEMMINAAFRRLQSTRSWQACSQPAKAVVSLGAGKR